MSVVDKPANRKKWLVIKNEDVNKRTLKEILEDRNEGEFWKVMDAFYLSLDEALQSGQDESEIADMIKTSAGQLTNELADIAKSEDEQLSLYFDLLTKIDLEGRLEDLTDEQVSGFFGAVRQLYDDMELELLEDIGATIVASMVAREMSVDWEDEFVQATGVQPPDNPNDYEGGKSMNVDEILQKIEEGELEREEAAKQIEEYLKSEEEDVGEEDVEQGDEVEKDEEDVEKAGEIKKRLEELEKRAKVAEDMAKKERELRLQSEFEKKAEDYTALGDKETVTKVLMKAHDNDLGDEVEKLLNSAAERINQSDLYKEKGSTESASISSAYDEVEKKAEELRKNDSSLTAEQAKVKVLEENPELYREYRQEVSQ